MKLFIYSPHLLIFQLLDLHRKPICAFPVTHQQQLDSKQGFRDLEEGNKEEEWKGHAEQVEEPEQKNQELVFWVNGFEIRYSKQRSFKRSYT